MRRTSIPPYTIYQLAKDFVESSKDDVPKRGRPLKYPNALIFTIIGIQSLYGFSYREALEFASWFFEEIPCLSDFHYRICIIAVCSFEAFLAFLGQKIIQEGLHADAYAIDGTCWSYQDVYPMKFLRGTQVRQIQAHVRTIVVAGLAHKKRFALAALSGGAYASEVRLGTQLISQTAVPRGSPPFLADRAYDSIAFLQTLTDKGYIPAVRMKDESLVKHSLRRESMLHARNQKLYGRRTQIESLFGNTKEKLGSHIRVFRTDAAQRFALMRLALFNISLLCELRGVRWWIFRTVSQNIDIN